MTTNRLRILREKNGEARTELATLCGVTERTIERWEGGVTGIPDAQKRLLGEHFGVSTDALMGWDRNEDHHEVVS